MTIWFFLFSFKENIYEGFSHKFRFFIDSKPKKKKKKKKKSRLPVFEIALEWNTMAFRF